MSWNCQYEWEKKQGFSSEKFASISMYDFDILLIQECTKKEFDAVKRSFTYRNWYCDDSEDSVLGTAIFSNKVAFEFTEKFNRNFRYVIPYKLLLNETVSIDLYSVWIKAPFDGKQNYAKVLVDALDYYQPDGRTIFIGDYNVGSNDEHPERYEELIREFGKYNLMNASTGTEFEFTNTHWNASTKKQYQNDYCFCSKDISVKAFEIPKHDEWEKISDHCPIIVEFDLKGTEI